MANRIALMGAADGPWVDISRMKKPWLRVKGLPAGGRLVVTLQGPRVEGKCVEQTLSFDTNGDHELEPAAWGQISCAAPSRHKTLCVFITKAA